MNKVKDKILEVMLKVIIEELSLRGVEADKLLLKLIKLKYSSLLDSYLSQVIKDIKLTTDWELVFDNLERNGRWNELHYRYAPTGMFEIDDDNLQSELAKIISENNKQIIDNLKEKYNINN